MDSEFVDELDAASRSVTGITRMPAEAATAYVQGLAEAFVAEPSSLHWWESLKGNAARIPYGNADGLAILASMLNRQADARLVVTDEDEPPWPVYAGSVLQLIAMLRKCRFCEYMMAAHDMSWIVFDNHMNELVSIGLEI